MIPAIREPIDTLRRGGFRVANDLYEDILRKAEVLRIAIPIADALARAHAHAHAAGIVHLDLKPANVVACCTRW